MTKGPHPGDGCGPLVVLSRGRGEPSRARGVPPETSRVTPGTGSQRRLTRDGSVATAQWKESPQAHEPVALGLSMVKPCFSMVSTKSICAPER